MLASVSSRLKARLPVVRAAAVPLTLLLRRSASSDIQSYFTVDNPYDGSVAATVQRLNARQAAAKVSLAKTAFDQWKRTDLEHRVDLCKKFLEEFTRRKGAIAKAITAQMGKPIQQSMNEVDGMVKRVGPLMQYAFSTFMPRPVMRDKQTFMRMTREPVGPVLLLSPWNYPLLTAANTVFHAVLAGCTVLVKHSDRTPLVAEVFQDVFQAVGAPPGLVQALHADHDLVAQVIHNPDIAYVQFTGSVEGGRKVYKQVSDRFIDVGLELGGKDAAYVCEDVDIASAAASLVDGAMYNAGQSCCSIERIYVHQSIYQPFLDECVRVTKQYILDDPMLPTTTMGPMAQPGAVGFLKAQIDDARAKGARILTGGEPTTDKAGKGRFFQPTVVADCDHTMSVMTEESFGPVVGIASVKSDEEAIKMMNDSKYGLTAAIYTDKNSKNRAERIAFELDVGTVYMNRCDFLDPALTWSGRKDSGKGVALSSTGFDPFLRNKSWNFNIA